MGNNIRMDVISNFFDDTRIKLKSANDYGLTLCSIIIIFYDSLLFFTSFTFYRVPQLLTLIPIFFAILLLLFFDKLWKRGGAQKFIATTSLIMVAVAVNYTVTGEMDRAVGGVERLDDFCVVFDNWLWGGAVALYISRVTSLLGNSVQTIFYDTIMFVYYLYFILPVIGAVLIFRGYGLKHRWKIIRFFFSFLISYILNNTFYLLIPVTGPQYYLKGLFIEKIPLSSFGYFLHKQIAVGQQTYIDCFPSGHVWITLLVAIWLFHVKSFWRYLSALITIFMVLATLGLRYHYTLDVIVGSLFAIAIFFLSFKLFPNR